MRQRLTNKLLIEYEMNRKRGEKKTIKEVLSSWPPVPETGYWIKSYEQLSESSTLEIKGKYLYPTIAPILPSSHR